MNALENELKQLIIDNLNLEDLTIDDIANDEPLFVTGLGLDSIDALELGMALQKKYQLKIRVKDENIRQYFYSVKTIADYIRSQATRGQDE